MKKQIICLMILTLIFGFAAIVSADDCDNTSKINEGEQKLSVVLPKVSGMEPMSFNDIACAVISRNGECASRQSIFDSSALTYDYASGEQMPVEKAYFVLKTDVKTPKGFGVVAFKDKAEAEKFSAAHGKGKVVKWFELVDERLK